MFARRMSTRRRAPDAGLPTPTEDLLENRAHVRGNGRPFRVALGVGMVVALLAAAACGGDDDDSAGTGTGGSEQGGATTTTAGEADLAAYCDAAEALGTRPDPDIDLVNMTEDQQTDAAITWAKETLQPLV